MEKQQLKKEREESKRVTDALKDQKPKSPFFSLMTLTDPNRMSIVNIALAIIALLILFYFGWGSNMIGDRTLGPLIKSI